MARKSTITLYSESYHLLARKLYDYRKTLGYAEQTCLSRYGYIKEFLSWLEKQGIREIEKVRPHTIRQYESYLNQRNSKNEVGVLHPKTVYEQLHNIRMLFIMLEEAEEISTNPTSALKINTPPKEEEISRTILSLSEINQLYEVCETTWEKALLALGYGCGLRVKEIQELQIGDVRLRDKILIVQKGKNTKRRVIPLSEGVVKLLADYYYGEEREASTKAMYYRKNQTTFFLNSRGSAVRYYTMNKYVKQLIERTENEVLINKAITMHHLRHTIATHLLAQGIKVEQVRLFLGHSQLETTQLYTHISEEQLKILMKCNH